MPFAGPSHVVSVTGMWKCFGRSDLVGDGAHGLGCLGTVGPNACFAAGLYVAGCEASHARKYS